MTWLQRIIDIVGREGAAARIVILSTDGPTPRPEGAAMIVWSGGREGKIGRGEAEARALEAARAMIGEILDTTASRPATWSRAVLRIATGTILGERSGGSIELLVEGFGRRELAVLGDGHGKSSALAIGRPTRAGVAPLVVVVEGRHALPPSWQDGLRRLEQSPSRSLVRLQPAGADDIVLERLAPARPCFNVYGSGLVARALVRLLADLPFDVVWLDTAPGHFPPVIHDCIRTVVGTDLALHAADAPSGSFHAVMTSDHDIDLAVTRALVRSGAAHYIGVIGSRLKRERLVARLRSEGLEPRAIEVIACPIGIPEIKSKDPAVIAVGIAAQVLMLTQGSHGQQ